MNSECLFCRIASGDIPASIVAEGEHWIAFRDIEPQAPVHALVIPRRHVASLDTLSPDERNLAGELALAAAHVARLEGIQDGYRVVTNIGEQAGQSVFHLHLHVLGGRGMSWPPG
ncbi:MAG: histidine triad nucleotide-binding protein [Gemmatimonadota bacterium]